MAGFNNTFDIFSIMQRYRQAYPVVFDLGTRPDTQIQFTLSTEQAQQLQSYSMRITGQWAMSKREVAENLGVPCGNLPVPDEEEI